MFRWKNAQLNSVEKQKLFRNTGTYTVLIVALFAMTFFGVCDPNQGGPRGPQGAAAIIEGQEVSVSQFRRHYNNQMRRLKDQYGEDFDPVKLRLAERTLDNLVNQEILYKAALAEGVGASEDEAVSLLKSAKLFKDEKDEFKEEIFKNWLRGNGYRGEADLLAEIRRDIALQKFSKLMSASSHITRKAAEFDYLLKETKINAEFVKISPSSVTVIPTNEEVAAFASADANKAKITAYFDTNKSLYNQPEQVKARHILIQYSGARNAIGEAAKRSKDQAKVKATELLQAAKGGQNFIALAKDNTDEPNGKTSGGDLGFFTRETMVKEFSDAAFNLQKGDLSAVVESPFGFHIIKVEDRKVAVSKALDDVKLEIAKTLLVKEKSPSLLKEKADLAYKEIKEKGSLPNPFKWEETGSFTLSTNSIPNLGSDEGLRASTLALKNPGDTSVAPILAGDSWYIVRLKSRNQANLSNADSNALQDSADNEAYSNGYQFFTSLRKQLREDYDKRKAVKLNPDYLALDNPKEQS